MRAGISPTATVSQLAVSVIGAPAYRTHGAPISGRKLSPVEAAELSRRAADARRKCEADEAQRHAEARERAAIIWQAAAPASVDHPYLIAKGVQALGIRQDGDKLLIPMRDASGVLHSLQLIASNGAKRFLYGGRVRG